VRFSTNGGEWAERTYWHRVVVFPSNKANRIEAQVQKGTCIRIAGQVRPTSYETDQRQIRYAIAFVVGPFDELEVLARGKPREEAIAPSERDRGKFVAASDLSAAT
jgi:single-stranded DNA-binding protein